jgi:hypothetical protein
MTTCVDDPDALDGSPSTWRAGCLVVGRKPEVCKATPPKRLRSAGDQDRGKWHEGRAPSSRWRSVQGPRYGAGGETSVPLASGRMLGSSYSASLSRTDSPGDKAGLDFWWRASVVQLLIYIPVRRRAKPPHRVLVHRNVPASLRLFGDELEFMSPRTFTLLMSLLVGLLAGASHRLGNYSASTGQHPLASMPVSDVDESASQRTEQAEKATPSVRIILPSPFEVRSN